MIYLLITTLLVLLVLIIVLAVFIFVQQKQIAVIKALASSSVSAPSSAPPPSAPLTSDPVPVASADEKDADDVPFTYKRRHTDRDTEVLALTTYQESLSLAQPALGLVREIAQNHTVLYLDLSLGHGAAELLGCNASAEDLQPVSETLAYLALHHVQQLEGVLREQTSHFDHIYVVLPSLTHSRAAAALPHVGAYGLLMVPDGNAHTLEQGLEALSKWTLPHHWLVGLIAVVDTPMNARHEQVVDALNASYTDVFLGCMTAEDYMSVGEAWLFQLSQRSAEKTLSLV